MEASYSEVKDIPSPYHSIEEKSRKRVYQVNSAGTEKNSQVIQNFLIRKHKTTHRTK